LDARLRVVRVKALVDLGDGPAADAELRCVLELIADSGATHYDVELAGLQGHVAVLNGDLDTARERWTWTAAQCRQTHDPRADQFAARLEQLPAVPPEPAPHRFRLPWRARRSGDEA
jgi:hypothetical protein